MSAPVKMSRLLLFTSKYRKYQFERVRQFCASHRNQSSDSNYVENEVKTERVEEISDSISVGDNTVKTKPDSGLQALEKSYDMFKRVDGSNKPAESTTSFASLLRKSKLMQIGDPVGRVVVGTVFEISNNDLYIDFGGKFHCVCPKPKHSNASKYQVGTQVRIRLMDLELSSRFMGSTRDLTLLEANAVLLGLHSDAKKVVKKVNSEQS